MIGRIDVSLSWISFDPCNLLADFCKQSGSCYIAINLTDAVHHDTACEPAQPPVVFLHKMFGNTVSAVRRHMHHRK